MPPFDDVSSFESTYAEISIVYVYKTTHTKNQFFHFLFLYYERLTGLTYFTALGNRVCAELRTSATVGRKTLSVADPC